MDSYFPPLDGGPPPTVASYSDDPHQTSFSSPPAAFEIDEFMDEAPLDQTSTATTYNNNPGINKGKSRRKLALMLLVGIGVAVAFFYLIRDQTKGESSVAQSSSSNSDNNDSDKMKLDDSAPTSTITSTNTTHHKHHNAMVNATDGLFQEALARLTQGMHDTPETASLQDWYRFGRSTPPLSQLQLHKQQCTRYFPGLGANLIHSSVRGQRLALVGDSTTVGLVKWLQLLLGHVSNDALDGLADMGLRNATHKMNPQYHHKNITLGNDGDIGDQHGTFVRYYNSSSRGTAHHAASNPSGTPPPQVLSKQCAWPNHMWKQVHTDQPTILVVNYGLDLLHLIGHGHNHDDTLLCTILQWKHYDHFLKEALLTAHKSSSVRLLLFKTTNRVCPGSYAEPWASGVTAYNSPSEKTTRAAVLHCTTWVHDQIQQQNDASEEDWMTVLTNRDIQEYCSMATMDSRGVDYLNQKLEAFVEAFHANQTQHYQQQHHNSNRRVQQQQQEQQSHPHDPHLTVAIYNDHNIQSCDYTEKKDGLHFHSMNLARIRLLGNMIQCLYSY